VLLGPYNFSFVTPRGCSGFAFELAVFVMSGGLCSKRFAIRSFCVCYGFLRHCCDVGLFIVVKDKGFYERQVLFVCHPLLPNAAIGIRTPGAGRADGRVRGAIGTTGARSGEAFAQS
jgi:hypothetical protein